MNRASTLLACLLAGMLTAWGIAALVDDGGDDATTGRTPAAATATAPDRRADRPRPSSGLAPLPERASRYAARPRIKPVPILMYHVISTPKRDTPFPELWVPWKRFAQQMVALEKAGYHGVTLGDVFSNWRRGLVLPPKPIVISFDDGYLSQYLHAAPTLRALGWPAVLNLTTKNIGPGGLTSHQVRAMMRAGWEVGSHTVNHADLTELDPVRLRDELVGSRRRLHRLFGVPVNFFCYPSGLFNADVEAAVRAAGYSGATTTQPGIAAPGDDPYALPRVRVDGTDSASDVLANLRALAATSAPPS